MVGQMFSQRSVSTFLKLLIFGTVVLLALVVFHPATQAANFVVNSTADSISPKLCLDTECTLREAILAANATIAIDTITFNIPAATDPGCNATTGVCTIKPTSALPDISFPVIIDGYTQPGASPNTNPIDLGSNAVLKIVLDGSLGGATVAGLLITAGNSIVKGLVVNRFFNNGILLSGNNGNVIEGNFIGTNATGTAVLGNSIRGVGISNSAGNTIGGTTPGARNIISGNGTIGIGGSGILIRNSGAVGNLVQGNYIGTDVTGTLDFGNVAAGIVISNSPNNRIGGTAAEARNIISGNDQGGIAIAGGSSTGNLVQGNYIGTNALGTVAIGNSGEGVYVGDGSGFIPPAAGHASNNTIGGTVAGAGNVISGNGLRGVLIKGSAATGNLVQGNFIGTNATGTAVLGNSGAGVLISGSPSNTIGGATPAARNVISGNFRGVFINGSTATVNLVQGNFIGTDVSGSAPLGNAGEGVLVDGASNNTIGGTAAGAGNVISGNGLRGVLINGSTATGNLVQGNYIGTNATGTAVLGNSNAGVLINGAADTTIGGTTATSHNVIAFNGGDGINISSGNRNQITGNSIHSNVGKGISLSPGSNNNQIPPTVSLGPTAVAGTTCSFCRVEVFSDDADEGRFFVGFTIADSTGNFSFPNVPAGPNITATATDTNGNTSAFSLPVPVTDSDGDGLLDIWETNGIDMNGDGIVDVDLPAMGANPNHKDIFLEIDWMEDNTNPDLTKRHSHKPWPEALQMVIDAFANAPVSNPDGITGINLHIDTGNMGGGNPLPEQEKIKFSTDDFTVLKNAINSATGKPNFDPNRRFVSHYAIFGHKDGTTAPPCPSNNNDCSGRAEILGNDLMVTLGDEAFNKNDFTILRQAKTLMHELGHNLGLNHGGPVLVGGTAQTKINCKPNYLSVMNHIFPQGIPDSTSSTGHRLDFSRQALPTLDENSLDENLGLQGNPALTSYYGPPKTNLGGTPAIDYNPAPGSGPIDWNLDGKIDGFSKGTQNISRNINNFGTDSSDKPIISGCSGSQYETLKGFDDWSNLVYDFRKFTTFGIGPDFTDAIDSALTSDPETPEIEDIQIIEREPPIAIERGDVNLDGVRDFFDLILIAKFLIGQETLSPEQQIRADADRDGDIDLQDVIHIADFLTGSISILREQVAPLSPVKSAAVSLILENNQLAPGEAGLVHLSASVGLLGIQVGPKGKLTFDPKVILVKEIRGVEPYQILASNIDNERGEVKFVVLAMGARGGNQIAELVVEAVGSPQKSSPVHLSVDMVVDLNKQSLVPKTQDGLITIGERVPLSVQTILATPNPVTRSLSVEFRVQGQGIKSVQVEIFSLTGHKVFKSEELGVSSVRWNLRNGIGQRASNGVYLYLVTVKGLNREIVRSQIKKLVILQ